MVSAAPVTEDAAATQPVRRPAKRRADRRAPRGRPSRGKKGGVKGALGAVPSGLRRLIGLLTGTEKRRAAKRPPPARPRRQGPDVGEDNEKEEEAGVWPAPRLALAQRLWGEGFVLPGGAEHVSELSKILRLDETKSLLNLGAGLGGPARALATEFGVWVTGLETCEQLIEPGKEQSRMAALARKADIKHYDPERAKFKEHAYDAVLAQEAFFTVADKEDLFKKLETTLRPEGDLVFTDFVLAQRRPLTEEAERWLEHEPVSPHLWTVAETVSALKDLAFHIHVADDMTKNYKRMVLKGWLAFVHTLTKAELTPDYLESICNEGEFWADRLAALDRGGVRFCRFHAERLRAPRS